MELQTKAVTSAPRRRLNDVRSQARWWLRGIASGFIETVNDLTSPWRRTAGRSGADLPAGASPLPRAITDTQFLTMMRESQPNFAATALAVVLFLLALWPVATRPYLIAWAGCSLALVGYAVVNHAKFMRATPAGDDLYAWQASFLPGLLVHGVMWGSVMFIPMPQEAVPYVALGLLMVIAGSVSLFAYYRAGISLFAVPCALLASTSLALSSGVLGMATGAGFAIAVALLVRLARVHNTSITQAMLVAEERKALLEELGHQRREAERASVAKTFFLASVSHDLRQPMHSIALLVAAFRRRGWADADMIEQIGASVQSMEDLLGALLEVSRLDAGTVPLQLAVFPINQMLERVHLQFDPQAQAKGLKLALADSPVRVYSDFFHLERIVSNLVANAIRYTTTGCVRIRCRRRGSILWVQVWDSGIGIARENRHKIFEDFFQVCRTARSSRQGLGLGLSIVQRTAHRLSHGLRVRSRPGRGSLFEIGIPVAIADADDPRAVQLAPLLDGRLVLLIDDDPMVLKSMATLLTTFNCQVLSAGTISDALAIVDETLRLPDLIISDYRLGDGITGPDAVARVRALTQEDIPAVLVTAEPAAVPQSFSAAIPVLAKPLHPAALAAALQRVFPAGERH
ncbi:ATP-binding response regulator [Noviherbaspirillum sp.]|uniref:ATP-binding response regulator n=1 Tax=Noviherbaspirillum sp. TaxID=1926288 RepID=UPI002FE1EE81